MTEKQIDFIKAIQNATNRWTCCIKHYYDNQLGYSLFTVDIKINKTDWNSKANNHY